MNDLAGTIGKNIASLRKAKGLTQQELAKEIHYSDKSISKWELGYAAPSIDILIDIARFFDVTVDYLLTEQSEDSIQEIVTTEEERKKNKNKEISEALIIAMSMVFCLFVAICVFFSPFFFNPSEGSYLWQAFIWMVPVAILVATLETIRFYKKSLVALSVLWSIFIWSVLLAFAIQFAFGNSPEYREPVWFILAVGAPLQAIIIIYTVYRHYQ